LNKLLPEAWRKDKKIEADIFKEHKRLVGTIDINAKYRYVQLVRSLKTYGITFYTVFEKVKDKKKPRRIYLGVTREKLVKMDGETRELMKEWPLEAMRRWAATNATFTLDFGDYEDDYLVFQTSEGEAISALIGGYIDIILKAQQEATKFKEEDDAEEASVSQVGLQSGQAFSSITQGYAGSFGGAIPTPQTVGGVQTVPQVMRGPNGQQIQYGGGAGGPGVAISRMAFPNAQKVNVIDVNSAFQATRALTAELGNGLEGFEGGGTLTADQWKDQMGTYMNGVNSDILKLLDQARMDPGKFDRNALDMTAKSLTQQVLGMAIAAKNLASLDGNTPLLTGAKAVSESITKLLGSINKYADMPGDPRLIYELVEAEKALKASTLALDQARVAHYADKGAELLILECVNDIGINLDDMIEVANQSSAEVGDAAQRQKLLEEAENAKAAKEWILGSISAMAPVAIDPNVQFSLLEASSSITGVANKLVNTTKASGVSEPWHARLDWAAKRLADATRLLLESRELVEPRGAEGELDMETPANLIMAAVSQIRKNIDNPKELVNPTKTGIGASNTLIKATKKLADASDDATRERLIKAAKNMSDTMQRLLDSVRILNKDPTNSKVRDDILDAASRLEAFTQDIVSDAGVTAALTGLRFYAKASTAKMIKLQSATGSSFVSLADEATRNTLWQLSAQLSDQINAMVAAVQDASKNADNFAKQNELLMTTKTNIPGFHQFLVESMKAQKHISDLNKKQDVGYAATEAGDAIKKLEKACKSVSDIGGQTEIEEALADFDAVNVDLDAAEFAASQGLLAGVPGQTRENAQELLALATRALATTVEHLVDAAKMGGKLSTHVRESAASIGQVAGAVRSMAATVADRPTQRRIIAAAKEVSGDTLHLIGSGRVLIIDRANPEKVKSVDTDYSKVRSSIATLLAASKGLDARECDEAVLSITAEKAKLTDSMPTGSSFKQASEALASVSKALSAAVSQLVAMARSNPRGVGSAAKITSSTMTQMIQATNVAASTAESGIAQDILAAARLLADRMIDLLQASKGAAANRDTQSIEELNSSAANTSDALQGVVTALGGAASPECEDAIRIIMDAIANIDKLDGIDGKGRARLLEEFTVGTQALASVTARIITAARVSTAKLGSFAKEAAVTIVSLLDNSKSAIKGGAEGGSSENAVNAPATEVIKCCAFILSNPEDLAKVIAVCKKAALAASKLIPITKDIAAALSGPEDKNKQQEILRAAKLMANNASRLAKASQIAATAKTPDSISQLNECARDLKDKTNELQDACQGIGGGAVSENVDAHAAQQLSAASKTVGVQTSQLIRAASNVAGNKNSDEAGAELSTATKSVNEALSALIAALASLNPGVQECSKAEDQLNVANADLDAVGVGITVGNLHLEAPAGRTHPQIQEELVESCKALGEDISSLSAAAASNNVQGLVDAARKYQGDSSSFVRSIKGAVATSPTQQAQNAYIAMGKGVTDALLHFVKQAKTVNANDRNSLDALSASANGASQAVGQVIAALQSGVAMVRDIEKAMADIQAAGQTVSQPPASAPAKRYGQYREEVAGWASRDLAELIQKIASTDPNTVGQLSLHSKRVAELFPKWVTNVRAAVATTTDAAAGQKIAHDAHALGNAIVAALDAAKAVAREPGNPIHQQTLRTATQPVYAGIAQLIQSLKKGAVGEVLADAAIADIQKSIGALNTAGIFAQAGQLEADKAVLSQTVTNLQEKLVQSANALNVGSQKLVDGAKQGQEQLGSAAQENAKLVATVANNATATASRMTDSGAQQDLLSAAKMLGIRTHQLILAAKDVERAPHDPAVLASVAGAQEGIRESISGLIQVAQTASSAAAAGERELENAKKAIMSIIANVPGYDAASPEDVIKAAREVTGSIADLVFATNQDEIVVAAQKALVATEKLLNSACTAARLSPDPNISRGLEDAVKNTAQMMVKLLETAKLNRQDPTTQGKLEQASSDVTNSMNNTVTALRALPNAADLSLDEGEDLEKLATDELAAAARVIEEAAATLARARPKHVVKDPNILDEATITDAIFAAAIAIAQATAKLVGAATVAQIERAEKTKGPAGRKYHSDPTWANGLISAAKSVAGAVKQLVNAANASAQGKADQEVLIASARAVAAATAQLVSASRAKADPNSKSQNSLSESAKMVTNATTKLVQAAQNAAQFKEEELEVGESSGMAQSQQAKFDQQIRILKLEAQIEAERRRLAKMNKAAYDKGK
jgi:talin